MTKNISEEELLLRKRARRRLVGAIILVLISVTVLPIIFDEPKSENEKHEIAINLPIPNQNDRHSFAPKAESVDRESTHGVDALPESQSKLRILHKMSRKASKYPVSRNAFRFQALNRKLINIPLN